ncbi:MAG: RagB/SusD family nutrient uptake outer membrane protein [Bacteroidetes bacterium]|nr:RagB/SusD family nutrient uptake outer membrane protein [Bacteroidota bacterium]
MKRTHIALFILALAIGFSACRKLDVPVESQYVSGNFPVTNNDYAALLGTMYTNLASNFAVTYWRMQELSTDEAILPARDGNFDDGGQYRQMHYHTWTYDHPYVTGIWQWGFGGINNCNRLINLTISSKADTTTKLRNIAEVRAMRALYYYFMMDLYGNVPVISTFPVDTLPHTQSRAAVFNYIENELKAVLPILPNKSNNSDTNRLQYGRPTRAMAFSILAKMYLNADIYTGGATRYNDVVAMCDSIQNNKNYTLDAKFRDIFLPNNGPQINETIFAIPYDQQIPGNQFTRFGFYYYLVNAYGFNVGLSIAMSTTPEFYNRFNIPGDFRTKTWLVGPQFYPDGNGGFTNQPVYYPGTTTQIVITPNLILVPPKPMDVGNTTASQAEGVRSIKYYPDPTTTQATRLNGNDVPVFRLSDIYLMKAEAELRGATTTTAGGALQTPQYLVNQLRTRSGAQLCPTVTLDTLLDERARELSWEGWRRNDLIRFGQYEKEYVLPNDNLSMDKSAYRRLFPIPISEIRLNSNLTQNPGYPK